MQILHWIRHSIQTMTMTTTTATNSMPPTTPRLWNPATWFGLWQAQTASTFCPLNPSRIMDALLRILVPWMVLHTITLRQSQQQQQQRPPMMILHGQYGIPHPLLPLVLTVASPWSIDPLQTLSQQLSSFVQTCQNWRNTRMSVLPDATDCFQQRLSSHQCQCLGPDVHVYLPSRKRTIRQRRETHEKGNNNTTIQQHALLFLPGALVPPRAYAEVAAALSDRGILVVVVSMEPFGMARPFLGADPIRMQRILQRVEQTVLSSSSSTTTQQQQETVLNSSTTTTTNDDTVQQHSSVPIFHWSIGGHSLGAFAAMRLFWLNHCRRQQQDNFVVFHKLIMWGAANLPHTRTDLSRLASRFLPVVSPILQTLVVQAANDAFCAMTDHDATIFRRDFDTDRTCFVTLPRGSHDQFGSYCTSSATTTTDDEDDAAARVQRRRQRREFHKQLVQTTVDFIKEKKSGKGDRG